MNLLAIDTSTELASIAILANDTVYSKEHNNIRQHAQFLLPMLDELMDEAKISLKNLDGLVFGSGPGSFTGLRVACSAVKALAFAADIPVYPVGSLQAIAYAACDGVITPENPVLAILDARMDEVYWQYFTDHTTYDPKVTRAGEICIPHDKPIILAGVGLDTYASSLPEAVQDIISVRKDVYPTAKVMLRLAQNTNINSVSLERVLPLYVRNQVVRG
ncbi:MAG: tRNA (adenosine(37)-N6)-threonylcarbamoyltransferase complex dimerization subunit type 1 TsaB [Legionellaceae bacterium]|nr:tRNA (adenosine(37)-N6)-threonylcarbamoyltransferase complex dimerization subunit type 1 TsaB [Legionellaceae bacterium]